MPRVNITGLGWADEVGADYNTRSRLADLPRIRTGKLVFPAWPPPAPRHRRPASGAAGTTPTGQPPVAGPRAAHETARLRQSRCHAATRRGPRDRSDAHAGHWPAGHLRPA